MKKQLIVTTLVFSATLFLTGCSSTIKLPTALQNNEKITSFSYEVDVEASTNAEGLVSGELFGGSPSSGTVEVSFEGKMKKADDRVQNTTDVDFSYGGVGVKFPIYVDASEKEFDFDLFVGVPEIFSSYLGEGIENVYLSGDNLKDLLKDQLSEEEYKQFDSTIDDSFGEDSKSKKVTDDMTKHLFAYIDKNSDKVQKFEKLEKKSASSNGVYTITLSKEDLENLVVTFLENEDYYKDLKEAVESSEDSSDEYAEEFPDAEDAIDEFKDGMDELDEFKAEFKFTIEDKFVTNTNIEIKATDAEGTEVNLSINSKLSEINKDFDIEFPDKKDDSTLDIIDYAKDYMYSDPYMEEEFSPDTDEPVTVAIDENGVLTIGEDSDYGWEDDTEDTDEYSNYDTMEELDDALADDVSTIGF